MVYYNTTAITVLQDGAIGTERQPQQPTHYFGSHWLLHLDPTQLKNCLVAHRALKGVLDPSQVLILGVVSAQSVLF